MARNESDNSRRLIISGVVAIALVVVIGFFFMGKQEANVSGTVTLDGTPLSAAQVVFIGEDANNQSPVVAQSDDAGKYSLTGNTGGGLPLGKYRVMVSKMSLQDGTRPAGEGLEKARVDGLLLNTLAKEYEDQATTPLKFELHQGANTIDLKLKK